MVAAGAPDTVGRGRGQRGAAPNCSMAVVLNALLILGTPAKGGGGAEQMHEGVV